ncbi:MAG TPA: glycosyl hydrolase 53 family protein [Abditibacteriaceae bacterium]|jgi:hypothetical protein|nr:glycosyl hydrolase 53 family protein [Abditibacteriaceae bacterium]
MLSFRGVANGVLCALFVTFCAASSTRIEAAPTQTGSISSRPFLMGFTRWPADLTLEGITISQDFAYKHGDIVSVMFIGGIPWQESLDGKPFSADVENNFQNLPPPGKKLFLSISPLNMGHNGLALNWGIKDNLPLPESWNKRALDSVEVKRAYLNFVLRAVQAMKPDYLAIGIESNVLLSHDATKWRQLKNLNRETYGAVKKKFPALPVLFTTDVLHFKEIAPEARGSHQAIEVADMMKWSDLFAMSLYPFMNADVKRPLPTDFLDFARSFRKPIAVSESGMTSRNVVLKSFKVTLEGSEDEQKSFVRQLLQTAARDNYRFVINFATTDFEKLCDKLPPPIDDLGRVWSFTGLQNSAQEAKPSLAVWDNFLRAKWKMTTP